MIRTFPRQWVQRVIAPAADQVIAAYPIPAGATLNNMWMDIHVLATAAIARTSASMYGIHGYILPVLDPDSGITPDAMWDTQIPKDAPLTSDSIDVDTVDAVTAPLFEIGETNAESLIEVGVAPHQVFSREEMITFAVNKGGWEHTADDYLPTAHFKAKISKSYHAQVPSFLLLAVSNPDTLASAVAYPVLNSSAEWAQLKYLGLTLELAMIDLIGLTESGAESPYEDSLARLSDYLELVFEETAAAFTNPTWRVFCKSSADITVPGTFEKITISGQP